MKYQVWISNIQYGVAHVEADNQKEAEEKASELYQKRCIDWFEEGISDITVEEEVK